MTEKDLYSISDLQERYGLRSRQSIYNWMKVLKIEPVVRGKLSTEQREKMDKFNEHLINGGKISNFGADPKEAPSPNLHIQIDASLIVAELTKLMEAIAPTVHLPKPLQVLGALEVAAEKGWLLTTEQVRELIGVRPKVKGSDRTFIHGSFAFVKSGKIGTQIAWKVVKVSSGD